MQWIPDCEMPVRRCSIAISAFPADFARYFSFCLLAGIIFNFTAFAQGNTQSAVPVSSDNPVFSVLLSETDIDNTIKTYRTNDPAQSVKAFQTKMPAAVTDLKTREGILRQLPATVQKLKIEDVEMTENLRRIIAPVLGLYGRDKVYDLIIFRHPTPIVLSDSGVVLVVSTGVIERARSDDEILGYIAHEVAHEIYAQYSIYSKYLLKMISEGGNETALKTKMAEILALIELQCDAFAALTLSSLNYNPLAFIESMERIGRDFPNHRLGFHPPDAIRRKLVEQISSPERLRRRTVISVSLQELKNLINQPG